LLILGLLSFYLEAQGRGASPLKPDSWWLTLEEGKRYFRNGSYGDALKSFEAARESRKNYYAKMERDLVTVLSIREVRRLEDDLGLVEVYIEKEFRVDAADALRELYYRVPKAELRNSARTALAELVKLKSYPDAEYWIGEVYRMEGETGIAIDQYAKAWRDRALLETPGFERDILYRIADLRRLRREYALPQENRETAPFNPGRAGMVWILEEILGADGLWSRESFNRSAMLKSLESNGVNRFLLLYRHNEPALERAHRTLGLYYYSGGRHGRAAEHLLFAFLIQNSVIIDSLLQSRYDYKFTALTALQGEIARNRDLAEYRDAADYFRTLYYLANSLYGSNRRGPAREIWTFLRDNAPGEWRGRAAAQLANPQMDPIPGAPGR
ncbi:MAG: hypothetical protein LBD09_06375, partial [Treponema sp.]|nr:hypothetical protein [Treponema sp.]